MGDENDVKRAEDEKTNCGDIFAALSETRDRRLAELGNAFSEFARRAESQARASGAVKRTLDEMVSLARGKGAFRARGGLLEDAVAALGGGCIAVSESFPDKVYSLSSSVALLRERLHSENNDASGVERIVSAILSVAANEEAVAWFEAASSVVERASATALDGLVRGMKDIADARTGEVLPPDVESAVRGFVAYASEKLVRAEPKIRNDGMTAKNVKTSALEFLGSLKAAVAPSPETPARRKGSAEAKCALHRLRELVSSVKSDCGVRMMRGCGGLMNEIMTQLDEMDAVLYESSERPKKTRRATAKNSASAGGATGSRAGRKSAVAAAAEAAARPLGALSPDSLELRAESTSFRIPGERGGPTEAEIQAEFEDGVPEICV